MVASVADGGRQGRREQARQLGAIETSGGRRGWWGQTRPMRAISLQAKSLVNTPPLAQGFADETKPKKQTEV